MTKVYDVFADEYIDREDMNLYAPPERYMEIDDNLLIKNAARWLNEGLNDGLNDGRMTKREIIEQLKSLKGHCEAIDWSDEK